MFSAAPSRNLPEVDLTIPALILPPGYVSQRIFVCTHPGVAAQNPSFCSFGERNFYFSWRSNQQVKNGCEIPSCTRSLYVLEILHQ